MLGPKLLQIYVYIMVVIMVLPILIVLPTALTASGYITFPPIGLTLNWFKAVFQDDILISSLIESLKLAGLSASVVVVIALFASLSIERKKIPGKNLLETFFTGPRIMPLIILVLALLIFYQYIGLHETFLGLALSHLVITLPFAFRTLLASVASIDITLEWSARILGANVIQTYLKIILPQIKTGMIAAFIFTFITSFNNVTMALFLTAPGQRTLPVELFRRLQVGGITPKVPAISFILALVSLILFIVLDRTLGIYKHLGGVQE